MAVSDASMRSLPAGGTSRISIDRPREFKTEFHPRSSRPDLLQSFEEFGITSHAPEAPTDEEPWRPFQSRGDFEFAEIAVDASLSKAHINALLDLISRVRTGQTEVTLKNENDLRQTYDNAAKELTPVCSDIWFVMVCRTINYSVLVHGNHSHCRVQEGRTHLQPLRTIDLGVGTRLVAESPARTPLRVGCTAPLQT